MSDLVYGGGGGGSGYYPPSFDPNNPMGTSGGGGSYNPSPSPDANYYSFTKQYADPLLTPEWFILNVNIGNPYTQTYKYTYISDYSNYWDYITHSGNIYYANETSSSHYYDVTVYNNAYIDFENKATAAQTEYYAAQTVIQYANIDSGRSDLVASYGNIKDSSIVAKIEQLGDLTAQYEKLKFEDDITDYLNRILDSDNAAELESLAQQITALDNQISKELIDYYRVQENIRREQRQDFTYDFNWLTDPYFGRGGGEFYVGRNIQQSIQQNQHTFLNLYTSGDMGDWMAGGTMYDSPRAGNILFNPLGSLNTTVFLGLENQNFSPSLPATLANPEVFRSFGTLAGDRGFSVLNFGIKK